MKAQIKKSVASKGKQKGKAKIIEDKRHGKKGKPLGAVDRKERSTKPKSTKKKVNSRVVMTNIKGKVLAVTDKKVKRKGKSVVDGDKRKNSCRTRMVTRTRKDKLVVSMEKNKSKPVVTVDKKKGRSVAINKKKDKPTIVENKKKFKATIVDKEEKNSTVVIDKSTLVMDQETNKLTVSMSVKESNPIVSLDKEDKHMVSMDKNNEQPVVAEDKLDGKLESIMVTQKDRTPMNISGAKDLEMKYCKEESNQFKLFRAVQLGIRPRPQKSSEQHLGDPSTQNQNEKDFKQKLGEVGKRHSTASDENGIRRKSLKRCCKDKPQNTGTNDREKQKKSLPKTQLLLKSSATKNKQIAGMSHPKRQGVIGNKSFNDKEESQRTTATRSKEKWKNLTVGDTDDKVKGNGTDANGINDKDTQGIVLPKNKLCVLNKEPQGTASANGSVKIGKNPSKKEILLKRYCFQSTTSDCNEKSEKRQEKNPPKNASIIKKSNPSGTSANDKAKLETQEDEVRIFDSFDEMQDAIMDVVKDERKREEAVQVLEQEGYKWKSGKARGQRIIDIMLETAGLCGAQVKETSIPYYTTKDPDVVVTTADGRQTTDLVDQTLQSALPAFSVPQEPQEMLDPEKQTEVELSNRCDDAGKVIGEAKPLSVMESVWRGLVDVEDICLACRTDQNVVGPHPVFHGGLCKMCRKNLLGGMYEREADGFHCNCTICGLNREDWVCDMLGCFRAYCSRCIESLVGAREVNRIRCTRQPWRCYTCDDKDSHGKLKRRQDWQTNILPFFHPQTLMWQNEAKKPIRVLSVLDGIAAGKVALAKLGIAVDMYAASEVGQREQDVSRTNHGDAIQLLPPIGKLDHEKVCNLGPINLLMGGALEHKTEKWDPNLKYMPSPFVEFYQVKTWLEEKKLNGDNRVMFWLYQHTMPVSAEIKEMVSRFLRCKPVLVDSEWFGGSQCQYCFWGNLPALEKPVERLRHIYDPRHHTYINQTSEEWTEANALFKGEGPVPNVSSGACMSMVENMQWNCISDREAGTIQETCGEKVKVIKMERMLGLPEGYTDTGKLSSRQRTQLLEQSTCVHVLQYLLKPLEPFFASVKEEQNSC